MVTVKIKKTISFNPVLYSWRTKDLKLNKISVSSVIQYHSICCHTINLLAFPVYSPIKESHKDYIDV